MKNCTFFLFSLIFLLTPFSIFSQEIDANKLVQKDGLHYEIGKEKPFTGKAITYHENGKKSSSTQFKDGKLKGKMKAWYPSGKQQVSGAINGMEKVGEWIAWYENGVKIRQGSFKNGKEEGDYFWWFENGKLNKKGVYHEGIADGKWEWYYENGQLMQEGILKGETNDGVWKDWYESGQQKMIGQFNNGVKEGDWTWWDEQGNVSKKKSYKNGLLVEGEEDLDSHLEKMEYYLGEKDFKQALIAIEKAIAMEENQTEDNPVYMGLVVYHSRVYSMFQYLDEAETILLEASGLESEDAAIIVESKPPLDQKKLNQLAKKISKFPEAESKVGPHISMALIYNMLGDTVNLQKEQQLMMERSGMKDWVINISMELYKIRAAKEDAFGYIKLINETVEKEGENRENQLQLASFLMRSGQFSEAEIISKKYLKENENDVQFLILKANLAMVNGNLEEMKGLEKKILELDPNAFDQE